MQLLMTFYCINFPFMVFRELHLNGLGVTSWIDPNMYTTDGINSNSSILTYGVTQGSILGPLHILYYTLMTLLNLLMYYHLFCLLMILIIFVSHSNLNYLID